MSTFDWAALRHDQLGEYRASGLPRWLTIPAFPTAVAEFCQKAEKPEATAIELGKVIEKDNGLTFELLRQVNSSAYGLRQKASTAQRAISVLGFHRSKLILLNAAAHLTLKSTGGSGFDHDAFSVANVQRGLFAQAIAKSLGADEDLAFSGGMLCDCVLPSLAANRSEFYLGLRQNAAKMQHATPHYEKQQFEFCHAYAAAQVCLGWKFPDDLICCILLHHATLQKLVELGLNGSAVVAVRLSAYLPEWFGQEPGGISSLIQVGQHFPSMNLETIAAEVDETTASMYPTWDKSRGIVAMMQQQLATAS